MKPNPSTGKTRTKLLYLRLLVAALGFCTITSAQLTPYTPTPEDAALLTNLFTQHEQQYKTLLAKLPSQYRDDYKKIYQQRWDNIKSKFDDKEIYTDKAAQQYLDALAREIKQANPALQQKEFRCYFSRSGVPNASYIGQGIILVNMGLFHRLENESQAVFVIAHEIAHFYLNHSDNAIDRYVTMVNSKEVQEELRKIKGTEYGKREQFEKMVKGLTFSTRRHSRDHESEADSMAVALVSNTRFDLRGVSATLTLLDTVDAERFDTHAALQTTFHTPAYPFQKKWIAREEGLLGGHAEIKEDEPLADSLKTHPDCQQRIKQVQPGIDKYNTGTRQPNVVDQALFDKLRNDFRYEMITYASNKGNYTRSLFLTLQLLQQKPGDAYLITQTGTLFNNMYAALKAHTLGKNVDLPGPGYTVPYNQLLQFIQNLHREQFAAISYHFLQKYQAQLTGYEPYKQAYSKSVQISQE